MIIISCWVTKILNTFITRFNVPDGEKKNYLRNEEGQFFSEKSEMAKLFPGAWNDIMKAGPSSDLIFSRYLFSLVISDDNSFLTVLPTEEEIHKIVNSLNS